LKDCIVELHSSGEGKSGDVTKVTLLWIGRWICLCHKPHFVHWFQLVIFVCLFKHVSMISNNW
jgi:hypothetical protein